MLIGDIEIANGHMSQSIQIALSNTSSQYQSIVSPTINQSDKSSSPRKLNPQHVVNLDSQDLSFETPQCDGKTNATKAKLLTNESINRIWTYTGSSHYLTLTKVCHLLELPYPKKGGVSEAKRLVEAHINENKFIESPVAKQYGMVRPVIVRAQLGEDKLEKPPIHQSQKFIKKPVSKTKTNPGKQKHQLNNSNDITHTRGKRRLETNIKDKSVEADETLLTGNITIINDSHMSQDGTLNSDPPSVYQNSLVSLVATPAKDHRPAELTTSSVSIRELRNSKKRLLSPSGKSKKRRILNVPALKELKLPEASTLIKKSASNLRNPNNSSATTTRSSSLGGLHFLSMHLRSSGR